MSQKIYADFNNADERGRVRLNTNGTAEDVTRLKIRFTDGMEITISDDELEADGVVRYSEGEKIWVVEIDWNRIRHLDEG